MGRVGPGMSRVCCAQEVILIFPILGPWHVLWAPVWHMVHNRRALGSRFGVHTKGPCVGLADS